jgi:site-specific DNA-methyltransferase (adenine-specific)
MLGAGMDQHIRGIGPTIIGEQAIHTGDCLRVMQTLPGASVDVVVTSPPYNLNLSYSTYRDRIDDGAYVDWIASVGEQIARLLKPDGSFFLNIAGSSSKPWLPFEVALALRRIFVLQNHIVWTKSITIDANPVGHFKPIGGERFVHHNHEHVFHFTRTGAVKLDRAAIGVAFKDKSNIARWGHARDVRCRGNTWFIPYRTVKSKVGKYNHPGTFPVELPLWCIFLHGRPGPVVLDPFLGTGTTLVACVQAGARGIGIDMDPGYAGVAASRVAEVAAASRAVVLAPAQVHELMKQPDGDCRGLMVGLQNRLNKTSGLLVLTEADQQAIADLGDARLQAVFAGHLPRTRRAGIGVLARPKIR